MSGVGLSSLIGFWNSQTVSPDSNTLSAPWGGKTRKWESGQERFQRGMEYGGLPSERSDGRGESSDGSDSKAGRQEKVEGTDRDGKNKEGKPGLSLLTGSALTHPPSPRSPGSPLSPSSPSVGGGRASKNTSPFARFRQLETQATQSHPGSPVPPTPDRMTSGTSLYRNSSLPASPRPPLSSPSTGAVAARSGSGAKEMILMWVQNKIKEYPIPMTNFSTCWNDGLAFCALIHVFYPDDFDWSALESKNRRHNFTFGFEKAEELAGIYPLLEVDDMVKFKKPDWKCVFTYVQSFYRRFRDGRSPPKAVGPAPGQVPLSPVALACLETQEIERRARQGGNKAPDMVKKTDSDTSQTKSMEQKDKIDCTKEVVEKKVEASREAVKVKTRPPPLECLKTAEEFSKSSTPQASTPSSLASTPMSPMAPVSNGNCLDSSSIEATKTAEKEEDAAECWTKKEEVRKNCQPVASF